MSGVIANSLTTLLVNRESVKLDGSLGWAVCRGVRDPARHQGWSPARFPQSTTTSLRPIIGAIMSRARATSWSSHQQDLLRHLRLQETCASILQIILPARGINHDDMNPVPGVYISVCCGVERSMRCHSECLIYPSRCCTVMSALLPIWAFPLPARLPPLSRPRDSMKDLNRSKSRCTCKDTIPFAPPTCVTTSSGLYVNCSKTFDLLSESCWNDTTPPLMIAPT